MILFDLKCRNGHVFEAWFKDGAAFDRQAAHREIACPVCGDSAIEKALMAPNLANTRKRNDGPGAKEAARMGRYMNALAELRQRVEKTCDNVGEKFPEEARKIHYGETEHRNIYGEASDEDATALRDEGVEFQKIPWLPDRDA